MKRRGVIAALLFASCALALNAQPHLDRVEPFRLKVQPSGWVKVDVYGTYPLLQAHEDLDQYEHWFVTRDGRPWQLCSRTSDSCRGAGWTNGRMSLELNAAQWTAAPGFIDLRMNEGLSADGHVDEPFSNAVRVPVLAAFGAPAQIVSVSKREFVSGGAENDFVFRIAANNFDPPSVVAVFRGDEIVHPRRVYDGTTIEVAVPAKYRDMDGELPVQLRTDSGGLSETTFIKVLKPKPATPRLMANIARTAPPTVVKPAVARGGAAAVSVDANLANAVHEAIVAKLGEAGKPLEVRAKDGVVTLSGVAANAAVRAAAENAARGVSGVKQVSNRIAIP